MYILLSFHFILFILLMGFSRKEYWSGFPFPSPVDHIRSDLSTMTCPSWVAPRAWLGFIELDKAVVLVGLDWLFSVSMVSVCLPSDALLQHLPSYLGFSYLGRGVSPHHCPSWPWMLNGGEVWQNVVHWRREWQATSIFLPWEPHKQYEKAKW